MNNNSVINEKKLTDLNLSFTPNPNTGDIARLSSFNAIRRSIELSLRIGVLDKPFREDMGGAINDQLFEVVSPEDIPAFKSQVQNIIERYEPRIGIKKLDIVGDFNNNQLEITLSYYIKSTQRKDTFTTVLGLSE